MKASFLWIGVGSTYITGIVLGQYLNPIFYEENNVDQIAFIITLTVALLSMDKTEIHIEWTVNAGDQSSPWILEIEKIINTNIKFR